jgi:hypothetical protein
MTIEQIGDKIIRDIEAFPEEARQFQGYSGPKTSWDEYKEQLQYEEYDSSEVFRQTIQSMIEDDVQELHDEEIESIYQTLYDGKYSGGLEEKRREVVDSIIEYIEGRAKSEDIDFREPGIEFIRYYVDDITIIAKVLKQIGSEEYIIQSYSEAIGINGEQGVSDLAFLDEENGLERISLDEFEKELSKMSAGVTLKDQLAGSPQKRIEHYWDNPKVQERMAATSKMLKQQAQERNRKRGLGQNPYEDDRSRHDSQPNYDPIEASMLPKEQGINSGDGRNLNINIDPEIIQAGVTLAGYHIESGERTFPDYANAMIQDMGDAIKPYLKMLYAAVRYYPNFNSEGMDSDDVVSKSDIEKITKERKEREEQKIKSLLKIGKEKLESLGGSINPNCSILGQLMIRVFNEETPDDLDLNMYDRNEMELEVSSLLYYSDPKVWIMLGLDDPERQEDITRMLSQANTEEEIRQVMIMELLYEAMRDEDFPNQLRISPAEKNRGEAFL